MVSDRIHVSLDCTPFKGAVMFKLLELIVEEEVPQPCRITADLHGESFVGIVVQEESYHAIVAEFQDVGSLENLPSDLMFHMLPSGIESSGSIPKARKGHTDTYKSELFGHELYVTVSHASDMLAFEKINPITLN